MVFCRFIALLLGVRAIVWELGPCAFTSQGEFEFCCCSLQSYCWGLVQPVFSNEWQTCCGGGERCPSDSQLVVHDNTPWQRGSSNGTFARYSRAGSALMSLTDILNCEHQPEWRQFRIQLQKHDPSKLTESQLRDPQLVAMAQQLLSRYNLSASDELFNRISLEHFVMFDGLHTLHPYILMPDDMFCLFGYMSASFIWALKVKDRSFLSKASLFIRGGNLQELDVSSSTNWPIGLWDLELNLGRQRPRRMKPLAAWAPAPLRAQALSIRDVVRSAGGQLRVEELHLVVGIYHPSLDLELVGFLLKHFPEKLQITLAFYPTESSYTKTSLASHICREWPSWCAPPHVVTALYKGDPPSQVDLSLCSLFWLCQDLERWMHRTTPVLALFGGFPWNSFAVRDGKATVDQELAPMWEYLERTETSAAPATLLTDAPYTSEILHSHTGVLLPVYRPVCPYLSDRWSQDQGAVFIPKATSAAKSSASGWMVAMLKSFSAKTVGASGEVQRSDLFVVQNGYLSFKALAAFKGVAYLPGPHSWVVCQWREFYNMNLPLLLPERKDLMVHSHYWIDRLWNNLRHVTPENWMPKREFWSQRHPFSPMPLVFSGAEYVKSHMYWSQWLEFFAWPHVQFYRGVPDLILKAQKLNFKAISERMSRSNRQAMQDAYDFWTEKLHILLPQPG